MKRLNKVSKADWDSVPIDPEPGFDPEHNKRVIAETIRKNELNRNRLRRNYHEKLDERSADLAHYIRGIDQGGRTTNINSYFGASHIARMRGEEIRDTLMANMTTEQLVRGLNAKKTS